MKDAQKRMSVLFLKYSTSEYIKISEDVYISDPPEKLNEAWYSEDTISFRTIATSINSEKDLIKLESELLVLENILKDEFSKLTDTGE